MVMATNASIVVLGASIYGEFIPDLRMSLRGGGPRGVGNLVIRIIHLYFLSLPKFPQGFFVHSPLEPPLLWDPIMIRSRGTRQVSDISLCEASRNSR